MKRLWSVILSVSMVFLSSVAFADFSADVGVFAFGYDVMPAAYTPDKDSDPDGLVLSCSGSSVGEQDLNNSVFTVNSWMAVAWSGARIVPRLAQVPIGFDYRSKYNYSSA